MIASGTTSSTIAATDHAGVCTTGLINSICMGVPASNLPKTITASAPTTSAPMIGGQRRPSCGNALKPSQATTMGAAIAVSLNTAWTRSRPKRRNTPATMPITIGNGTSAIARLTQPLTPSTSINKPVA